MMSLFRFFLLEFDVRVEMWEGKCEKVLVSPVLEGFLIDWCWLALSPWFTRFVYEGLGIICWHVMCLSSSVLLTLLEANYSADAVLIEIEG